MSAAAIPFWHTRCVGESLEGAFQGRAVPRSEVSKEDAVSRFQACLEACQKCVVECERCLYEMAGKASPNDCPKCCIECVDICEQCIRAMARDSTEAAQAPSA